MKSRFLTLSLLTFLAAAAHAAPLGTAFTYQGRLDDGVLPVNGLYDFNFKLFDAATSGTLVGPALGVSLNTVGVSNGVFSIDLDFGTVFNGDKRWLEISVNTNTARPLAVLEPRLPLNATPYALYALRSGLADSATTATVANSVAASGVNNAALAANAVTGAKIANGSVVRSVNGLTDALTLAAGANITLTPAGNTLTISGTGGGGLPAWLLNGNAGTATTNFLGTIDDKPLEIRVNNERILRYVDTSDTPQIIGGWSGNSIAADAPGAVIAGGGTVIPLNGAPQPNVIRSGGDYGFIGGGYNNRLSGLEATITGGAVNTNGATAGSIGGGFYNFLTGAFGTISGGQSNVNVAVSATIGGGSGNFASGQDAVVAGGTGNRATASQSTVSGGALNSALGSSSVVVGGQRNFTDGTASFVGGGVNNILTNGSQWSAVLSGVGNRVTNAWRATILNGESNTVANVADYATVLGGRGVVVDKFGQIAFGHRFATNGDAQASLFHLRGSTTGASTGDLNLNGAGNRLTVPRHSGWAFRALVIGKALNTPAAAAFEVRGLVVNVDGSTTVFTTTTALGSYAGIAGFNATAVADDANDALLIRVTSPVVATVRWSAQVETAEVNAPSTLF